jgi:hypothetical protein
MSVLKFMIADMGDQVHVLRVVQEVKVEQHETIGYDSLDQKSREMAVEAARARAEELNLELEKRG